MVSMFQYFSNKSNSIIHESSFINNHKAMYEILISSKYQNKKIILIGLSFALLDFSKKYVIDNDDLIVIETGGMKDNGMAIDKATLLDEIKKGFPNSPIHSEYGMTELLSQAYLLGDDGFRLPPWMKVIIRDITDPFAKGLLSQTGGINVIDLANWNTISFIETEDLGRAASNGTFEVLGRIDNSDVRGCNLLIG